MVRPMIVVFALANVAHALLLVRYVKFPLPIAFDLIIALVLIGALARGGTGRRAAPLPIEDRALASKASAASQ
jgi:uncharacterized membrane protein